jgi:hypothetical protein
MFLRRSLFKDSAAFLISLANKLPSFISWSSDRTIVIGFLEISPDCFLTRTRSWWASVFWSLVTCTLEQILRQIYKIKRNKWYLHCITIRIW